MIDKAFEDRLYNWGEYYLPSCGGSGMSPTAIICERLAISAGKQPKDGYRETYAPPVIDEADAQIIEWCWAMSGYRIDARLRGLLRAHYVFTADKRITCRALKITYRRYDATLEEAVRKFKDYVDLNENVRNNCGKTNEPPGNAETMPTRRSA